MKFLVTACLLSERLKPRPKPGIQEFFERSAIAIPFATYLTIERGLDILARNKADKEAQLRGDIMTMLAGCEFVQGYDAEIARAMARILGHGSLRHTWLPNAKAKEPSYGHYPWVAAASLVTGIPIAAVKTTDVLAVGNYFELPGVYDPVRKTWLSTNFCTEALGGEAPSSNGASPPR
ncbi:type II toxin-antitoxin system VapC family toxin [Sinorhizobium meliloti]|uniref:type II toxin-antitoxin system VapC family toxin n=1 Tax=Rhizobium meliloti TaxID=382 RepID=UPI000FD82413|nr:type II toxin-antitoxin system VapC family toxin [Sinorhizobium meliloti]RVK38549.1 type II toxin-antitoxin system VapC family toxin [Sinorhizobium meliloti]